MTNQHNTTVSQATIGVMDSGVGGLSVLAHCIQQIPQASYVYMADSQFAPYGPKPVAVIEQRCLNIAQKLIEQQAKVIVVACNTATAAAIAVLRRRYPDMPIIGMEPAVKPAVLATHNQKIGVLATTGTLKSAQFAALLDNYGQNVTVITQACEGLVECVEKGAIQASETQALLRKYCAPLMTAGVDAIVLGCTHYPFLKQEIQSIVGPAVSLIETGEAVAKQLQSQLEQAGLLSVLISEDSDRPAVKVLTNSTNSDAQQVIRYLLPAVEKLSFKTASF